MPYRSISVIFLMSGTIRLDTPRPSRPKLLGPRVKSVLDGHLDRAKCVGGDELAGVLVFGSGVAGAADAENGQEGGAENDLAADHERGRGGHDQAEGFAGV